MSQITLSLPDEMTAELSDAGRESNISPEAVAEDMVRRMLALRRFDRLRAEARAAARPGAPATEDDIFGQIS